MSGVPIVDIFAGPGGLAEGFSTLLEEGQRVFDVRLSIEKDEIARRTLRLRSFVRQFKHGALPGGYYDYVREATPTNLAALFRAHPIEAKASDSEASVLELGQSTRPAATKLIEAALGKNHGAWALIGGPPCQAYSLVGRSRLLPKLGAQFFEDEKHTLYKEYLYILAKHEPDVFVMENVRGMLSSRTADQTRIFPLIQRDLRSPGTALGLTSSIRYKLFALASNGKQQELADARQDDTDDAGVKFIVECERYGAPQARHRVIILGINEKHLSKDGKFRPPELELDDAAPISVDDAIRDLPRLRSGVSTGDSLDAWQHIIRRLGESPWLGDIDARVKARLVEIAANPLSLSRGGEFFDTEGRKQATVFAETLRDQRLGGACNHSSRGHIATDIERYAFASAYAEIFGVSPKLGQFPKKLWPAHKNIQDAVDGKKFSDRFRVQLKSTPSTTITSHISKDGHYFIHYDPSQARSLTVREAARLQTFPDNYFFEGPRTEQYKQVGNAVPPAVARRIAVVVKGTLEQLGLLARPGPKRAFGD